MCKIQTNANINSSTSKAGTAITINTKYQPGFLQFRGYRDNKVCITGHNLVLIALYGLDIYPV